MLADHPSAGASVRAMTGVTDIVVLKPQRYDLTTFFASTTVPGGHD